MYLRFAGSLPGFLAHTLTREEAEAVVRRRLADRESNFLRLVEKGIFGFPRSPYLPLLRLAGCELGDIRKMVADRGLEGTLRALREAGVYVTFEEFKGREPLIRNGRSIPVKAGDFDNPYLKRHYQVRSGGTTGAGTRVTHDLDHLGDRAPYLLLACSAHGVLDAPAAIWRGTLPIGSGVNIILSRARYGKLPRKWFSPVIHRDRRQPLRFRLATLGLLVGGRILGAPIPRPEPVTLHQAAVPARWAFETCRAEGSCVIHCSVSLALRICLAAREESLDLTGTTFMSGDEPPTPAKVRGIEAAGGRFVPTYFFSEAGAVGWGCARPADVSDLHFFRDSLALIQHPRLLPVSGATVETFHFTSLLWTAPKLLLNVESDDFGVMERRSCGCPLEGFGFTEHLRQIGSFSKLTGEGMTLVGSEMVRILEEVLPARFGGSPLDFQLLEEEDERGLTRLSLVISPKVGAVDEGEVIGVVMEALERGSTQATLARDIWGQAGTLRIRRMEPVLTDRGKQMPLHIERR
jgi:hypothetical protein